MPLLRGCIKSQSTLKKRNLKGYLVGEKGYTKWKDT